MDRAVKKKRFKVGEAPWEQKKTAKKTFKVGEAPWEKSPQGEKKQAEPAKIAESSPEEPGLGSQLLEYAGKGLDYVGGLGRVAAGGVHDTVSMLANMDVDAPTVSRSGDWERALKGEAPTGSELLERRGMEPGLGREAAGLAVDIFADPLTYGTGGAAVAGKLGKLKGVFGKLIKPGKSVGSALGNTMIRSGVSQIDEGLEIAGKGKISDILIEEGITGTNKTIKKKVDDLGKRYSKERKSLYADVDKAGGQIDMNNILNEFGEYTSKFRSKTDNAIGNDVANKMEDLLFRAVPKDGKISLQQASNIKTQLRKSLPDSFYNNFGQVKDEYKQGLDKLSSVFQKNIEKSADEVLPGVGQAIAEKNKKWGVLLDADSPLSREARKAAGKNMLTTVDAMFGFGANLSGAEMGLAGLAAKKAADISKTTVFRTKGGKLFKDAGSISDPILRRMFIDSQRKEK